MFKVSGDVLAAFCSEDGKRGNDERVYIQLPVRIYIKGKVTQHVGHLRMSKRDN